MDEESPLIVDHEVRRQVRIVCPQCGREKGAISLAECPGTDECEGLYEVFIEGVDFES